MSDTTTPKGQALTPAIGGLYNWKGQPERLVYMGAMRYPGDPRPWHQFAKVEAPHMCWSEVLTSELAMFEETKGTPMTTIPTSGAADLPEALRVPLDSLHADAGYLCGRLLNGSLTQEQVVESIRRRIDAAKLAALTAQAISKAPDHIPEVGNMVAQAISAEPAGAGYAALPDAKTLGEAVAAWIGVETRGAHKRVDTTVDRLGFAVRSVVGDMLRASNGQAPAGVLHLVQDAFAEIAMAFPKAFALHKVGIADTAACRDFGARDFGKDKTMTEPTDALELLREIYADLVQGAIPNADDHWWQKARAVLAKWGTPQPSPAEPLTDAQIAEMMRDTWGCASIAPRHALEFARVVERAHGIKGGQHGTE